MLKFYLFIVIFNVKILFFETVYDFVTYNLPILDIIVDI